MDYCTNDTSEDFEQKMLSEILGNLRKFDKRTLETKPMMARARKRIVFGAIETRKLLELGKVKAIIVARNLTDETLLDDDFKFCIEQSSIPVIYCLTRKQLGTTLLNPTSRIGIIGILKLDGVNEAWNETTEVWKGLSNSWSEKYESDCDSLWIASFYGHLCLLKNMGKLNPIEFKKKLNQGKVDYYGKTPLAVAIERDHYETAKFLIECGADEDIPDFTLNRPIHLVKSGKTAELLKYNEKLNLLGLSAIEIALEAQMLDAVKVFIKNPVDIPIEKLLEAAVKAKSDKSIDFLARHYIIKTFDGNLVMKVVENGSYEVFKYLVSKKCPIPGNCLQVARTVGNVGILRYLEKHSREEFADK